MSVYSNKFIVKKSKEILKELGYDVKTSHIYDFLSRLAGETNWHVASAKKVSFADYLATVPITDDKMVLIKNAVLKSLKQGSFKEKPYFGTNEDLKHNEKYFLNWILAGPLNSGTDSMVSTTSFMWLLNNKNGKVFFTGLDNNKFLQTLRLSPNVTKVGNDEYSLTILIDSLYKKMIERQLDYKHAKIDSVEDLRNYEIKREIQPILVSIGSLDQIVYQKLDFSKNFKNSGTAAYKLIRLMRSGRSHGIYFMVTAENVSQSDIPKEIMECFSHKFMTSSNRAESQYFLGHEKASEINTQDYYNTIVDERGQFYQFPDFSEGELKTLMKP